MADSEKYSSRTSTGDVAYVLVKAGLSAIPVIGGPVAEIFAAIVTPPLAKRRDDWMESVGSALKQLEEKVEGLSLENLSCNESFITIAMKASNLALSSHHKEKREALRNAVLNAAMPEHPDDVQQLMFLRLVDDLTPLQLRVLSVVPEKQVNPEVLFSEHHELFSYVQTVYADICCSRMGGGPSIIVAELSHYNLIHADSPEDDTVSLTQYGKKFLAYITSPINE